MKTIPLLVLLSAAIMAQAQPFSITSSLAGATGGVSSGGAFAVAGTVGEPVTSAMAGGGFTVATGFWNLVGTVVTPDAPSLVIESQPDGSMVVSWPATATGFALEQNRDLDPLGWVSAPYPVSDDGTWKSVRLSAPTGLQFFRLKN